MCRWLQDTQWPGSNAAAAQEQQQNDLASLQPQQPEAKDSETAGVRMESQVVFDACWRRFEERHKLKVRVVGRDVGEAGCFCQRL